MDKYIVLNNGIKVAINNHYDIVSRIIIAIMAGSRDCGNELCGLAHFSEHILLTDMHDKKDAIINCDGKTTNEETVISLTCLNDDFNRALLLIRNCLSLEEIPYSSYEKEKEIIKSEIKRRSVFSNDFSNSINLQLFEGGLEYDTLGSDVLLDNITLEEILNFRNKYYISNNISISISTSLNVEYVTDMVSTSLGRIKSGQEINRKPCQQKSQYYITQRHKQDYVCNLYCYPIKIPFSLYSPLDLLLFFIGGKTSNNRLMEGLLMKGLKVYNAAMRIVKYSDFSVVFLEYDCPAGSVRAYEKAIKSIIESTILPYNEDQMDKLVKNYIISYISYMNLDERLYMVCRDMLYNNSFFCQERDTLNYAKIVTADCLKKAFIKYIKTFS